ncbi:MAG: DUF262 domain-containing protein [Candidatus Ryanbacteria bacterium]|nr:DUF262 domain-containing protein [Candidatus Ryanbacteria bacterium]
MGLYRDETISKIIEGVNDKYFLPDIQRPFVWKQEQIYALFDSIMRGYPINTFLFWQISKDYLEENRIKKFPFVKNNKQTSEEDLGYSSSEYSLVLDGQQRITSLYIALKGSYFERKKEKELFFNVLTGKDENDDGLLFEFKFLDKSKDAFFSENNATWLNVKRIYECNKSEDKFDIRNKVTSSLLDSDGKQLAEKNIDILYDRLKSQQIINYYPEEEKDYDRVLDIFVRTNSGGTKLTYSDLLFSTIKLRWREARENFASILKDMNGEDFDFDTDFILKTCFVFFAETQKDVKYSRKNVDDEIKIHQIIDNWEKIIDSLRIARDLLNRARINHSKLLSSNNALIPIAYFIYKYDFKSFGDSNQNKIISPEVENELRNFLLASLLTGLFGGQADTILFSIKQEIDNQTEEVFPLKEIKSSLIKKNKSLDITEEFLDNVRYQGKNSYLILNLLYPNIELRTVSKTNVPEQDHLFSKDELRSSLHTLEEINSIYNIRYVTSTSNKKKSNIPFKEWLGSITDEEKTIHLVPKGDWDEKSYREFTKERKQLIINKLKSLMSK